MAGRWLRWGLPSAPGGTTVPPGSSLPTTAPPGPGERDARPGYTVRPARAPGRARNTNA